jgi:hypothetical protein
MNDVDILLEVSNRLNDPYRFYKGSLRNGNDTKQCTLGHLEDVIREFGYTTHNYAAQNTNNKLSRVLNEKARIMYPDCPTVGGPMPFDKVCIASVNDYLGRIPAKAVVDAVIKDLKNANS